MAENKPNILRGKLTAKKGMLGGISNKVKVMSYKGLKTDTVEVIVDNDQQTIVANLLKATGVAGGGVLYDAVQKLTEAQKKIARSNIDAVAANNPILPSDTHKLVTYDNKGLVTSGRDIERDDIPEKLNGAEFLGQVQFNQDVEFNGNIYQKGSVYELHGTKVYSKDNYIITRDGAIRGLDEGEYTGIIAYKYDGENSGGLIYDSHGIARVGDIDTEFVQLENKPVKMIDALGYYFKENDQYIVIAEDTITEKRYEEEIEAVYRQEIVETHTQALATRLETGDSNLVNNKLLIWDEENQILVAPDFIYEQTTDTTEPSADDGEITYISSIEVDQNGRVSATNLRTSTIKKSWRPIRVNGNDFLVSTDGKTVEFKDGSSISIKEVADDGSVTISINNKADEIDKLENDDVSDAYQFLSYNSEGLITKAKGKAYQQTLSINGNILGTLYGVESIADLRAISLYGAERQIGVTESKRYLLGSESLDNMANTDVNSKVYSQNNKLFSNDSEVVNLADDQEITGVKKYSNTLEMNSNIVASEDDTHNIGSEESKFKEVHATTFKGHLIGDVTGNADTADKVNHKFSFSNGEGTTDTFDGSEDKSIVDNYLDLHNNQEVNGVKTFNTGIEMASDVTAKDDVTVDIGSKEKRFKTVYSSEFEGHLTGNVEGNATSADKVNTAITFASGKDTTDSFDGSVAKTLVDKYVDVFNDQKINGVKNFQDASIFGSSESDNITIKNNKIDSNHTLLLNSESKQDIHIGDTENNGYLVTMQDGYVAIKPAVTNNADLGTEENKWKNIYASNNADIGNNITAGNDLTVANKTTTKELLVNNDAQFDGNVSIGKQLTVDGITQLKAATTITGDLTVTGNITQQGTLYVTHAEKVHSKNDYIVMREGNTSGLAQGEYTGFEFVNYDGQSNGRLVVDSTGTARVGDVGDERPLATREETPLDKGFAKWDASTFTFVTDTDVATNTDLEALEKVVDTKVSQFNNDRGNPIVYGRNQNNEEYVYNLIGDRLVAWSLLQRNENGQIVIGEPTADNHGATKKYVDDIHQSIKDNFVLNTDFATSDKAGIVKINSEYGVTINTNNELVLVRANADHINQRIGHHAILTDQIADVLATGYIIGESAPTNKTKGEYIGQFYIDTVNKKMYQCLGIDEVSDLYVWEEAAYSDAKLDKVTSTGSDRVYVVDKDGNQTVNAISAESDPSSIVVRDSEGRIKASDPEADDDVVTKSYMAENGGKIDIIEVNGEDVEISQPDKRVKLTIPVSLSELEEDPATSVHVTEQEKLDWNDKVDYDEMEQYVSDNAGIGCKLELTVDKDYVLTISLLNSKDEVISTQNVDLPLESMVVDASYEEGILTLELNNGNNVAVDIKSLISGLVPETRTIVGLDLKDDITKIEMLEALGLGESANANIIEVIKVNGEEQEVVEKEVDIFVPTKTSEIDNDSHFITYDEAEGSDEERVDPLNAYLLKEEASKTYSVLTHNHDEVYSKIHDHPYSLDTHNHDDMYSKLDHNHDNIYSKLDHTHAGMATETFVQAKIEEIPEPDISGDIAEHNADETAHEIRFKNYLPLAGGSLTGDVSLNGTTGTDNRATLKLVSSGDYPTDLLFGSSNINYWSITSRDSSLNHALRLYNANNYKYAITIRNDTNITEFSVRPQVLNTKIALIDDFYKAVTYSELVTLRANSELIPGSLYRIIDFVTTVGDSNAMSANHPYDIIVEATTSNSLSEDARAALHEGDIYFADKNIESWKIKYCLDNDISRFSWVDAVNGKGVVYYMLDSNGNECWYDFKNIMYKGSSFRDMGRNNEHTYASLGMDPDTYYFTFHNTALADLDMSDNENCQNNHIGRDYSGGSYQRLNKIVFYNTRIDIMERCSCNNIDDNCYSMLFGSGCYDNAVGHSSIGLFFGNWSRLNYLENNIYYSSLENSTYANHISVQSFRFTIGPSCKNNYIGPNCSEFKLSQYVSNSTLEGNNKYIQITNTTGSDSKINNLIFTQGFSGDNNTYLEAYDDSIVNKSYRITYTKDEDGNYIMSWKNTLLTEKGKYKANVSDETWVDIEPLVTIEDYIE